MNGKRKSTIKIYAAISYSTFSLQDSSIRYNKILVPKDLTLVLLNNKPHYAITYCHDAIFAIQQLVYPKNFDLFDPQDGWYQTVFRLNKHACLVAILSLRTCERRRSCRQV